MDGPEVVEASAEKLAELQRLQAKNAELERRIAAMAPARPRPWHTQARPEQLPPAGDWDIWLYLAGRGCVAGGSLVYLPVEDRHERIDVLAAEGVPVDVLSLTPTGPAVARTEGAPFLKGWAPLFEVVCDDGSRITVTDQHRFLAPQGWLRLSEVRVGQRLAGGAPAPFAQHRVLASVGARAEFPPAAPVAGVQWTTVRSVVPKGTGPYFDLTVPGWDNYAAHGLWHHNSGKTRSGAEWIIEQAARTPDSEWAVVAPTWRDCQKVCFEGSSGLVRSLLPGEFESMNMSALQLRLSNGSRIYGYSADRPDRLRGANLSGAWIDEISSMIRSDDLMGEALMPALRIGEHPRVMITTTPRPVKVIKDLVARTDGSVVVVRGKTWDNAANLSKTALAALRARYEGTRMGRQELEAEILEDVEGALWTRERLDASRVDAAPHMVRIVVGVDPAVTSGEKSDFTGIVVAGKSADGDLYILEDLTMKGSPHACMVTAVNAYKKWEADRIVGEVNNGGDYLEGLLRTVDPSVSYKSVRATRGKTVRAEPIASLWEQGRGHIVGVMPALEDEMCSFSLDGSTGEHDDRVDACFVAGTPVLLERGEVPIEQVVPGDLAWTRAGWKPVLRSELTRRDAAVMTIELSNGHRLTGTSNHRVWANNVWSDLDSLVWGDILDGWTSLPCPSFSTASDTPETLTRNNAATGSITSRQADANASTYTAQSGGQLTRGEQFPRGGTSTTSTMIRSTTPPPTSRPSALSTTAPAMPGSAVTPSARTSNGSGPLPLHGTEARRESSGTASTASARGTTGSTGPSRVNAAASSTRLGKPESTHGSAPEPAATVSTTSRTDIRCRFPAPSAGRSSGNPSTGQSPSRVATSVVRRFVEPERRDVYDLMVADQHEFVAAGVIVHNCTWAATELSVGASAMVYLSAISRVCDRCDMPNRRTDAACRGCGEQLPAVA